MIVAFRSRDGATTPNMDVIHRYINRTWILVSEGSIIRDYRLYAPLESISITVDCLCAAIATVARRFEHASTIGPCLLSTSTK